MSRRITYDYCDYLRNIIQKHKNLIWLVTYLHVLLNIKRYIQIQINGNEMIFVWYNNKYNKYVCTVDIYIYIYICIYVCIYIYVWQLNQCYK